jgi:mitochondrial protein import protein ZIM17
VPQRPGFATARSVAQPIRWAKPAQGVASCRQAHSSSRREESLDHDIQAMLRKSPAGPGPATSPNSPVMSAPSATDAAQPKTKIPRPPQTVPIGAGSKQPPHHWPKPYYQLTFTCLPCGHRSSHNISKQGYHRGSVLISCPSCRNRHVISDHLKIFGDRDITVEDLMKEKGRLVKKGTLGEDGDIEFWRDELPPKEEGEKAGKAARGQVLGRLGASPE